MTATQDANAEIVIRHIKSLHARRTTFMGIGTIGGLLAGLFVGCILVFSLNMSEKWIGVGAIGMVLGALAGALAGSIRQADLEAITESLKHTSGDSNMNKTAANQPSEGSR